MATYRFEQFNIDIVNPTVTANEDSIGIQPSTNTIAVDVTLTTDSATFGLRLDTIQCQNMSYEGQENLLLRVNERLQDFIV
jgi:hypothetical protein